MMFLLSAFFIGLAGSVHCVGMCGPFALAVPNIGKTKSSNFFFRAFSYQFSRILGYGFLGLIVGVLSKGMQFTGFQPIFSVSSGIFMLFLGFFGITPELNSFSKIPILNRFQSNLNRWMGKIMSVNPVGAPFLLGFLNALLPCGMIYVALGTGLSSGSVSEASLYLMSFGLGTLPLMLSLSIFGQYISIQMRRKWQKTIPIFFIITGILLINKGLNTELPNHYKFWEWGIQENNCKE